MANVDVDRYLDRIGYAGWVRPDRATLAALQRAHLATVPFENLDVYYRRGVHIGPEWALAKVVDRQRGGWCFELNTAFSELLMALGFEVTRFGAEVLFGDAPPDTPDHLTLQVTIDGRPWLVDVGFGDSFCRPLALDTSDAQDGESRPYRFSRDADYVVMEAESDGEWAPQFRFRPHGIDLDVLEPASERLQHTEGLHWTETRFATRLYSSGRVTLFHDRLKLDRGIDGSTEEDVDEDRWHVELERWFGITGLPRVAR